MKKVRTVYLVYAGNLTKYKIGGRPVVVRARINKFGVAKVLSPKAFVFWWSVIPQATPETGWLTCEGPARVVTDAEHKEFAWQLFVAKAFILADLSEVDSGELPSGLLTNLQISERYRDDPDALYDLANKASTLPDANEKRRYMSLEANRREQDSIE